MPLYSCNSSPGAIPDAAKPKIAEDITRIHCDLTGAPPSFVHAFFFEDAPFQPRHGKTVFLFGTIREGRTDEQKAQIRDEMSASIAMHAGVPRDEILVLTRDTPASWVMEGGEILPEPGEEGNWFAEHEAKKAGSDTSR